MNIVVIGGTNFIGPAMLRLLHQRGHALTIVHRGAHEPALPAGIRHIHGDRGDLGRFAADLRVVAPDVVLDMIAFTEAEARTVLDLFRGHAGRLVAVSSCDVYRAYGRLHGSEPGPPDPTPLDEDAPLRERPNPESRLSGRVERDKVLMERVALGDAVLPGTTLRLPMVYGPGDYMRRLHLFLKRMDDGRPAILLSEAFARWRWSRGYVENVVGAVVAAIEDGRAAGKAYNVAEPAALSMADWVRAIGRAAGWGGRVVIAPDGSGLYGGGFDSLALEQDWVIDTGRIRRDLGYRERVSPDEAMRRTVDWERANPPDQIDPATFDYAQEDQLLRDLG